MWCACLLFRQRQGLAPLEVAAGLPVRATVSPLSTWQRRRSFGSTSAPTPAMEGALLTFPSGFAHRGGFYALSRRRWLVFGGWCIGANVVLVSRLLKQNKADASSCGLSGASFVSGTPHTQLLEPWQRQCCMPRTAAPAQPEAAAGSWLRQQMRARRRTLTRRAAPSVTAPLGWTPPLNATEVSPCLSVLYNVLFNSCED